MKLLAPAVLCLALLSCRDGDDEVTRLREENAALKSRLDASGFRRTPMDQAAAVLLDVTQRRILSPLDHTLSGEIERASQALVKLGGDTEKGMIQNFHDRTVSLAKDIQELRTEIEIRSNKARGINEPRKSDMTEIPDKELGEILDGSQQEYDSHLKMSWEDFKAQSSKFVEKRS
jgi:hypothetical protein